LLGSAAAADRSAVLATHMERRWSHLIEGFEQVIGVLSTQSEKSCEALLELWSPFLSVIRQDWARQRTGANR
jgi:hypothetical protein